MPFPFVERGRVVRRPALIVSRPVGVDRALVWTMMITTASQGAWPGDVAIGADHDRYGLTTQCSIRTAKIAAVEVAGIDRIIGRLPSAVLAEVRQHIQRALT